MRSDKPEPEGFIIEDLLNFYLIIYGQSLGTGEKGEGLSASGWRRGREIHPDSRQIDRGRERQKKEREMENMNINASIKTRLRRHYKE